jgi:uncharacterized membrane protein
MAKTDCENSQAGDNSTLRQNVRRLAEQRRAEDARRSWSEHAADWMTRWTGSMTFLWLHAIWFALWIAVNQELTPLPSFDPFPYGLLTTTVSLEAIFLSTFVLISQNRQSAWTDRQSKLDLQINLLTEHEMTKALKLLQALSERLDVKADGMDDISELTQEVTPEKVLQDLEKDD